MNILEEAQEKVYGDRPKTYGHPRDHWGFTIAALNAYLIARRWSPTSGLIPEDWPQIMGIDKIGRQVGSLVGTGELHRDTLVDQAGYPAAAERLSEPDEMVYEERAKRQREADLPRQLHEVK